MRTLTTSNGVEILLDDEDYIYFHVWSWAFSKMAYRGSRGVTTYLHIEIMKRAGLHVEGKQVDHKDRNPRNCQKENMRMATFAQNRQNVAGSQYGTSQYKGVSWRVDLQRWGAQISTTSQGCRKTTWLGSFKTEAEAARAYNRAAKRLHGEFAFLNDVPEDTATEKKS